MSAINTWINSLSKPDEYYFYKGNIYRKIDEITTKHPITREWVPYVLYENAEHQFFSREINEFYERFTLVKDPAVKFPNFNALR